MSQTYLKYAAAAGLFLLWLAVDLLRVNDPTLISAIQWALGALGVYHAATNLQGNSQISELLQAVQQMAPRAPAKPGLPTVPLKDVS